MYFCIVKVKDTETKIENNGITNEKNTEKMKKWAIYNKNNERMYQFPVFYYPELANSVLRRQQTINPEAGLHLVQIQGGEA